jgi:hypothetical protein
VGRWRKFRNCKIWNGGRNSNCRFSIWRCYFSSTNASTEEYDGSVWTAGGNLGTATSVLAGTGIQTAALAFGGNSTSPSNTTEEYNGSAWTAGGSLNTGRVRLAGAGLQTAALAIGGQPGSGQPSVGNTEQYDGTSWVSAPPIINC